MKISLVLIVLTVASPAWAFVATPYARPSLALQASQRTVDLNTLIENAIHDAENRCEDARAAECAVWWDIVEELEAADSHSRQTPAKIEAPEVIKAAPAKPTVQQDNSEAVKLALEASKKFGGTSVEARVAWDIVEELDAANSHHRPEDIHVKKEKPVAASVVTKEEWTKPFRPLPTTVEEAIKVASLASKIYGKHSVDARMAWELVEEMDAASSHTRDDKKAKEEKPRVEEPPVKTFAIQSVKDTTDAIDAALEASKVFGKTSVEARTAWEAVEEMDAANAHHKTTGTG